MVIDNRSVYFFLSLNTESINFDQHLRCGGWLNFEGHVLLRRVFSLIQKSDQNYWIFGCFHWYTTQFAITGTALNYSMTHNIRGVGVDVRIEVHFNYIQTSNLNGSFFLNIQIKVHYCQNDKRSNRIERP